MNHPSVKRIVLLGAGNLATNLGKALYRAHFDIVQVYSRTLQSAQTLASVLESQATNDTEDIVKDADVYIISVKDSALREVIDKVCGGRSQGVFLHTAGSMPLDVFKGEAQHYGVLYPMQTFSKSREVDFHVIPTFVEWNDETAHQAIDAITRAITDKVYPLASADRKYLHLAAVWACNFANHCYDVSAQILEEHNIPFEVMLPLIDETAAKVHEMDPRRAQTGPAKRFDKNVIQAHEALMDAHPLWQDLYELMSRSIHARMNDDK